MSAVEPIPLPAAPPRDRRWFPVVGVAALIVAVVSGGYLVADALGEPAAGTIDVGEAVRVTPQPGWELVERFQSPVGIRLTNGSGNLDVATTPFTGTDIDLLVDYVESVLEPDAKQLQVSGDVEAVPVGSGLTGARIAYVGLFGDVQAPIEGTVTATVSPTGSGVVFDGWAPQGQLRFAADDIEAMIRSTEIA
ncbi:MAG TPA: hypothetical protein VIC58_05510 [Actinomycetota bacterium]